MRSRASNASTRRFSALYSEYETERDRLPPDRGLSAAEEEDASTAEEEDASPERMGGGEEGEAAPAP